MTRENTIESYFKNQVSRCGALPLKFISPSLNGVPDQLVLFKGKTFYAEIKAPGEKPRADQVAVHNKFKRHGITVTVIDCKDDVDAFIKNTLKTTIKKHKSTTTTKIIKNGFL